MTDERRPPENRPASRTTVRRRKSARKQPRRKRSPWLILVLVVVAAAAAGWWYGQRGGDEDVEDFPDLVEGPAVDAPMSGDRAVVEPVDGPGSREGAALVARLDAAGGSEQVADHRLDRTNSAAAGGSIDRLPEGPQTAEFGDVGSEFLGNQIVCLELSPNHDGLEVLGPHHGPQPAPAGRPAGMAVQVGGLNRGRAQPEFAGRSDAGHAVLGAVVSQKFFHQSVGSQAAAVAAVDQFRPAFGIDNIET